MSRRAGDSEFARHQVDDEAPSVAFGDSSPETGERNRGADAPAYLESQVSPAAYVNAPTKPNTISNAMSAMMIHSSSSAR